MLARTTNLAKTLAVWFKRRTTALGVALASLGEIVVGIPCACVFSLPSGFAYPDQFSISKYAGLVFCHVVRSANGDTLILYWSDEAHLGLYLDALVQDLNIKVKPQAVGSAIELRPRSSWWKRYSLAGKIVAVAALFGAFSAIQSSVAVWVSAPRASISYAETGRLDAVEGSDIVVPVTVTSEVRFAPLQVTFDPPTIRSRSGNALQTLKVDAASLPPNLNPGQSIQVKIYGTAPKLDSGQTSSVGYDISVSASVKAGILRSSNNADAGKRELRVWPATLRKRAIAFARRYGNSCQFEDTLYLSRPYRRGLLGEIVAAGPPGEVSDLNTTALFDSRDHDALRTTIKVKFHTPPFEAAFQEYKYQVYLDLSAPPSDETCRAWSGKLDTRFKEVEE